MTFSNSFSSHKIVEFDKKKLPKFVIEGPIDNKLVLVQVMNWAELMPNHYLKQLLYSSLKHISMGWCKKDVTPVR